MRVRDGPGSQVRSCAREPQGQAGASPAGDASARRITSSTSLC